MARDDGPPATAPGEKSGGARRPGAKRSEAGALPTRTGSTSPAEARIARPRRAARSEEERREKLTAILDAALDVFSEKGFADARLDEIAARAAVAKGTVYLYVSSKHDLLERLIRTGIALPLEEAQRRILASDASAEDLLRMLFAFLGTEILATRRREIARIVLAEAARHPEFAAFYYREVVSRGLRLLRSIAERGVASGEFGSDELARFPQVILAPALVAILWANLFERFEPLDVGAMLDTHVGLLMRAVKAPAP